MNLPNKPENRFPEKVEKEFAPVYVDWKVYTVDMDAIVGYGKYVGKTVQWIAGNDGKYYQWMHKAGIFGSWGLVKKRVQEKSTINNHFISSTGEIWIGLREVPVK